jgi:S-adenosylmethionine uptake transporter
VGVTLTAALFLPGASMAPVSLGVWALLAGSAAFLMTAYLMSVVVMRAAEVSVTAPFRYTGLLWALILGLAIFGEWPDPATLLGAAIVVGSGLFALRRERVVAARGAPPSCGRRNR